jgi:general secretion pathway protein G
MALTGFPAASIESTEEEVPVMKSSMPDESASRYVARQYHEPLATAATRHVSSGCHAEVLRDGDLGPGPWKTCRALLLRRAHRMSRGVTLMEVLIVVLIIAMVAGGVTVFALPRYRDAQVRSAETWARTIRAAIQNWQAATNETGCPTISQLVQEKHLDPGTSTKDPWGQDFTLNCTEDEIYVTSMGPDKKKGTKDDIQIPKAPAVGSEQGY